MKFSTKHLLLLSAVALASQSSVVLAEEAAVTSDAPDAAAEMKAEEAVEEPVEEPIEEVAEEVAEEAVEEPIEEAVEEPVEEAAGVAADECSADGSCAAEYLDVEEPAAPPAAEEDPKCPSRPHVIRCAAKYLDTNQNGALEREELDKAMGQVSWLLRGLLKVIGSVDAIMKKCDADGDGKITIEHDMKATEETCLATCFKRKSFKNLFFPECTE